MNPYYQNPYYQNPYYLNPYYQNPYHQNQSKISTTNILIVVVIFSVISFLYLNPEYLDDSSNYYVKKMNDSIKTFEDCYEKLSKVVSENEKMCKTGSKIDPKGITKMVCIDPQKIPKNYLRNGGNLKPLWTNDRIEPVNAYYKYIKCKNETKNCGTNIDFKDDCAQKNNLQKYEGQLCLIM